MAPRQTLAVLCENAILKLKNAAQPWLLLQYLQNVLKVSSDSKRTDLARLDTAFQKREQLVRRLFDLGRGIQFVKWNSLSSTNRLLEIQNIGQEPPLIADGVGSGNASVCRINT
jgi:hypothetical protein